LHHINCARIFSLIALAGLLSSVNVEGASFSFSMSRSSSQDPYTTNNRPWGNVEAFKPGLKYEQPPPLGDSAYPGTANIYPGNQYPGAAPGSQYLGAAPGTGWYSANIPGVGNPASGGQPYVEVETSENVAYEQQNLVYTVRVVSSENLKTLNPRMPRIEGATLELVDGPLASTRNAGRNRSQEIVNEYRFKLTPLRPGKIVIPAMRFTGTRAASRQWNTPPGMPAGGTESSFSIASDNPLTLQVLPADPAITPWLPLNDLSLRMQLPDNGPAKAGVPVTLTLELNARGALGTQLPSLEQQIKSDKFRAYRDSITTSSGISRNGKQLLGTRKESYTIIPLENGRIQLPAVQVSWWDVDTDSPMLAGLPGRDNASAVAGNRRTGLAAREQRMFPAYFWAPMLVIIGLIVGYWLGAWARTRPLLYSAGRRVGTWASAAGQQIARISVATGRRLSPDPLVNKLRLGAALVMPKTVKLWLCIRCIEHEEKPEAWCRQFRSRICRHLDISRHTPVSAIAEKLIEAQPQAEPARVRSLAQSLDSAVYGAGPLDFPAWKKDFRYQLRPQLFRRRRSRLQAARSVLPELNPHRA
jgi:hypothetical protein